MNGLETLIGGALNSAFGNPAMIGIIFLFVIIAIIAVAKIGVEAGAVIFIPALMLLFSSIPAWGVLKLVVMFLIGMIVFWMIWKAIGR